MNQALFLWVIYPYSAIMIFIVGHMWRWRHDQRRWTSLSTQLMEKRLLRIGSPLFHYGALMAIFGHVLGLLIPAWWFFSVGMTEEQWHTLAGYAGGMAASAALLGFLILMYRRFRYARVRISTSPNDLITLGLLLLAMGTGTFATFGVTLLGPGYAYRFTISPWFRHLFDLHPNYHVMAGIPLVYKIHVLTAFTLFAWWPFSRLVHAWSFPFKYPFRQPIVIRKRRVLKKV